MNLNNHLGENVVYHINHCMNQKQPMTEKTVKLDEKTAKILAEPMCYGNFDNNNEDNNTNCPRFAKKNAVCKLCKKYSKR
jgi:hypothetical protein